jgi:anti-sigma B factor antagonist
MNFESKKEGDIILVKPLSKKIDAASSKEFKGSMVDLINQGNNFCLLNLSQVDFIDSSGLGAIISILKNLRLNKGNIVICEIKAPVLNLLKLTRMDQVFDICSNEKDGLALLINSKNNLA